jgi:hypothetical protein
MSVVRSSILVLITLLPSLAAAQTSSTPASSGTAQQASAATAPDADLQVNPAEPDFTLSALPTTLRMPSRKFAFRLTHRFSRPIASGSTGEVFADFFQYEIGVLYRVIHGVP